jgi:hypothetical protein
MQSIPRLVIGKQMDAIKEDLSVLQKTVWTNNYGVILAGIHTARAD